MATIVVPPKRTAAVDPQATGPWKQRNKPSSGSPMSDDVSGARSRKRTGWRGARTAYFGTNAIGSGLRARMFDAQEREAMIGVLVINRMTELGMPESTAVVN